MNEICNLTSLKKITIKYVTNVPLKPLFLDYVPTFWYFHDIDFGVLNIYIDSLGLYFWELEHQMDRHLSLVLIFVSGIAMSGCASMTNWTPTVDPHNDPNAANIEQDLTECKELAKKVTGGGVEEGLGLGAGLAAVGAGIGAVIGSVSFGDAGGGAAIGAAIGGGSGVAAGGLHGEMTYKQAYINCVAMRGHRVIDP